MEKFGLLRRVSMIFVVCVATAIASSAQGFRTLHVFDGTDGEFIQAGLVLATDGDFDGTTAYGGTYTWGTVFKITSTGTLNTLHNFCSRTNALTAPALRPRSFKPPMATSTGQLSFLLIPQIDSQGGLPGNVDGSHFTLVTSYTSNRSDWLNSECVNIFDGEIYHLALKQTDKLDKVIPRTYGHVLYLYTKHPEAKSLAPDGTACTCETRGLFQRSSVVAASRRYVGKETDRRWEQGEDLSPVEFKAVEYEGSKQVIASDEIKEQILKTGIRKIEPETGVSHHTIDRILKGQHVRRKTLAKIAGHEASGFRNSSSYDPSV